MSSKCGIQLGSAGTHIQFDCKVATDLRAGKEQLRRENIALAHMYALCEQKLRERTERLNQADAENQRLRQLLREHGIEDV